MDSVLLLNSATMELHSILAERIPFVYLHRSIENVSEKAIAQTKVVQVAGARQTGKTTVIQNNFPDYH